MFPIIFPLVILTHNKRFLKDYKSLFLTFYLRKKTLTPNNINKRLDKTFGCVTLLSC